MAEPNTLEGTNIKASEFQNLLSKAHYGEQVFSMTGTKQNGNEIHYNFHGSVQNQDSGILASPEQDQAFKASSSSYTLIYNKDNDEYYLKTTTRKLGGEVDKDDVLVGSLGKAKDFENRVKELSGREVSGGEALESLHNVEFHKSTGHGQPTGKGETPEVDQAQGR